jgi:Tfp pilus assembly protein PilE
MTERGMERERHTMKRKCIFFTLVELIIVIVCTCILFLAWTLYEEYVLHPKELDRELVCACYLQQIYKACHQYSLSNDGRFPCASVIYFPL